MNRKKIRKKYPQNTNGSLRVSIHSDDAKSQQWDWPLWIPAVSWEKLSIPAALTYPSHGVRTTLSTQWDGLSPWSRRRESNVSFHRHPQAKMETRLSVSLRALKQVNNCIWYERPFWNIMTIKYKKGLIK